MQPVKNYINQLKNSGLESAEDFLYAFLKIEDEFINTQKNLKVIKSEIYMNDVRDHGVYVKLPGMFSDFASLYIGSSKKNDMHITFFNQESPYGYSRNITIPSTLIPIELNINSKTVYKLFEVTLPFFKSASIETISKVLKDENDLLSSFRVKLK